MIILKKIRITAEKSYEMDNFYLWSELERGKNLPFGQN